ncbi:MAG: mandelate racemase/muconate lactonizing enzyme family protein, partial [Bryobacteraceae bacterium]
MFIEKELLIMHRPGRSSVTRRNLLTSVAGGAAAGSLFKLAESTASAQANPAQPVNRFSAPSNLKITDIRAATVATYYDYPLIRIDTNQGVYGLGEVFAAGTKGSALMLKPFLVGRNPVEIEAILRPLRGSVGQSFWNSGYGAIDLALHDIAGKVYGVPAWRLLGEKLQNRVLLYADTAGAKDPKQYAQRVDRRRKMGFRFFKMDLETPLVADRQGAVFPNGIATDKGLGYLCEYLAAARDVLGKGVPIAGDHFVQPEERMSVKDAIRYARAFEPYGLAWAEDLIGRNSVRWREFKEIRQNTTTPILTGEMAFGVEGFRELIENQAVDIIHP